MVIDGASNNSVNLYALLLYWHCSTTINFFFSSRRRHTRSLCDWSSDVCSSDLYIVGRLCELDRYYHASQGSTSLKCSILFWGLKLGYYFLSCKARSPCTAPYFYWSFSYFNSILQALGQSYKETLLQSEYSTLKQLLTSQVRIHLWSYLQLWAYGTFCF